MEKLINRVRKDRLPLLFNRVRTLFLMVLAAPLVLFVRLLRPLAIVRFGRLESRRLGHFISNTEIYLCERDAGLHRGRTLDIFYHYLPISNYQIKKMWERTRRLYICPLTSFMQAADRLNCLLPGGQQHMVILTADDMRNLRARNKPYLFFTPEEEEQGGRELEKLGILNGASFVCFHARDSAYLDRTYPEYNWRYQDVRDSSIHNYIPAAEKLTRRGYFTLRMGSIVKEPLRSTNPMVIDYPFKGRTDFLDIYLGAKCRFFICDTAGVSSIPTAFRRPIAWVNYVPLGAMPNCGLQDLLIPKKLWLRNEQRFLSLSEILTSDIKGLPYKYYIQLGIEPVENTPEEITALAIEMDERLNGKWQASEEDELLQRRFWSLFKSGELNRPFLVRIGAEFLRQSKELVESQMKEK